MADNVAITAGSGTTVAADDIGSGVLAQRVKPVWGPDGTGTDVDAGSGLPVQSGWRELTGSASANNTDLVSADVSGYRWVSVQISGTFNATVSFQCSNDGTTWVAAFLISPNSGASSMVNLSASTGLWWGPISARYFRVRTTSYTSGTASTVVELGAQPSGSFGVSLVNAPTVVSVSATGGLTASDANTSLYWAIVNSNGLIFNGSTWDRLRTPTTFKSATATASGNTALWTPTSGKKFRLMRYKIDVSQDVAQSAGGVITIGLQDATTDVGVSQSVFVPGTAATAMGSGWSSGWIDLGNGRLSSAINQVLNINLSAALTSGTVRVVACGTEE